MRKRLFIAFLICLTWLSVFSISASASTATTLSSLMKDLKESTKESLYNTSLNTPFSKETSGIRETVSTETGSLIVTNKILNIPGRNGMDLSLNLIYNNQTAKLYNEGTVGKSIPNSYGSVVAYYEIYNSSGLWIRTGALLYTADEATILGTTAIDSANWVFNGFLQYPAGTSLFTCNGIINKTQEKSISDAAKYTFGIGWCLELPSLIIDGNSIYATMPNGQTYKTDITTASGLSGYKLNDIRFNTDTTRNNGIDSSAYKLYYADGSTDYFTQNGEILLQTDRFGNTITYYWTSANGVTLLTKIIDTVGRIITIEYNDTATYIKYDDKVISLLKKQVTGVSGKYYLSCYIDEADRKTNYSYSYDNANFDFLNGVSANNIYMNLVSVNYSTGFKTNYSYTKSVKNLMASGSIQYFKVCIRWDSVAAKNYNEQKFFYSNEPDGYPLYKPSAIDQNYIYSTTVVTKNGDIMRYFYNYKHLLYKKETISNGTAEIEKIKYDVYKNVPVRIETSKENKNGSFIKTVDTYSYDNRGNLIFENHPIEPTDEANGEYIIAYTYDLLYNLMTSKSFKQDEDTTVIVKYSLSNDRKIITTEETFSNGNLLQSKKYDYDNFGNVIEVSTQKNYNKWATIRYVYSSEYNYAYMTSIIYNDVENADGKLQDIIETYTYDFYSGVKLSVTDGNGYTTKYEYDKLERILKEALPDGFCRTYNYDDKNNVLTETDANGNSLLYHYNPFGQISSVIEKAKGTLLTVKKYDNKNNLIISTDANGNKTHYTYDSAKRITSTIIYDVKNIVVSKTEVSYYDNYTDVYGNTYLKVTLTKQGSVSDLVTNYYYDGRERLVKLGSVSNDGEDFNYYSYDYLGNKISETGCDGAQTVYTYDIFGKTLTSINAIGAVTSYKYDGLGNLMSTTNSLGNIVYTAYDSLGHLIRQDTPQGDGVYAITRYYYDGIGNLIKTIDAEGYTTRLYYNKRGFLFAKEQKMSYTQSNIVKMEYDAEGNQIALYNGISNWNDNSYTKYIYAYDVYGNVIEETDALGMVTNYTYDNNGNLTSSTDRNHVTTYYSYDGLNRQISQFNSKDGKAAAIIHNYDLNGSLINSFDASGKTSFIYDSFGRIKIIIYDSGMKKEYTYDDAGRVASFIVKQGSVIEMSLAYEYDKAGQLLCLVSNGIRTNYKYNAMGQLISETNGLTSIVSDYEYYPSGAIKRLRTSYSGEFVNNFEYEYDLRGNQTKKDENGNITEYYYDALSRLRIAMFSGTVQYYVYDDLSNITKLAEMTTDTIKETLYYYDGNSRLVLKEIDATGSNLQNRYEYDAEGNQVYNEEVVTQGSSGTSTSKYIFLFNGLNQLEAVTCPSGEIYEYTYNAEGLRTSKVSQDKAINYLYESGYIIFETDADYNIKAKNVWGKKLLFRETNDAIYSYLFNGHGDIIAFTDANGNTVKDYSYDPYGNEIVDTEPTFGEVWNAETTNIDSPFRYCGEYYDLETKTYYLRARNYDPTTGRFLSEDSYRGKAEDPLSLNLYTYCNNNPIKYSDPSGHIALVDDAAIVLVYATGVAVTGTYAYLSSPEGQKAINDGATAIYNGVVIAGKAVTSAAKAAVKGVVKGATWVGNKVEEGYENVKDWFNELAGNSSSPDPDKDPNGKYSLKKIGSNKEANRIAQENGYKNAEALKQNYVGKSNISKFNMKYDSKTGEIILEAIKTGVQVATGLFK